MRPLEVVDSRPPNFDAIVAVFPDAAKPGVIFAYGGRIYAPGGVNVSPALQEHEQVHIAQQGDDPDAWWARYLVDPAFRFAQEMEAHRVEWLAYCRRHASPFKRSQALGIIAHTLSSSLYGSLVTLDEAKKAITS